jgi:tight adherence protein B
MLLKIMIFLIVFAGVFYLTNLFYPLFERRTLHWHKKRVEKITPKLDDMFLQIPLPRIILLDILTPLLTGALGFFISKNLWIGLGALGLGFAIPFLIIKQLEQNRRKKFTSQLVDALMILSSSLKAGLSLPQAFGVLVEEMPAPLSQEFNLVLRQLQMGVSLEGVMASLKKRMRIEDLDIVVTAMMVARETGGDLTVVFAQIAATIRERNKLFSRVNALCAQGNLQGAIMSFIPIVFGFFVYKMSPNFFGVFLKDNFGKMLLAYAAVSEILGIFFIRKLSRIEI